MSTSSILSPAPLNKVPHLPTVGTRKTNYVGGVINQIEKKSSINVTFYENAIDFIINL